MKLLGITLCDYRENVIKLSKRQMLEKYNINAHTINAIESGKGVRIPQLLDYCNAIGFDIVVTVEEKDK